MHQFSVDRETGVATYLDAAQALVGVGGHFGSSDWRRPSACTGWDAAALAGHVFCVVPWHHEWLDRAESGQTSPPWPPDELTVRNQAALDNLDIPDGPTRLGVFRSAARHYADRLWGTWDLPFWYPGGLVTVGLHAVLAAGEWQLHAWDLGHAIGFEHQPDATLIRDTWVGLGRQIEPDGDPWQALLRASGRPDRLMWT
ncbi:MAG: maleylpyruvate isomerase N-terminal domain-containing protein [Acidimicrobiales bacterium]